MLKGGTVYFRNLLNMSEKLILMSKLLEIFFFQVVCKQT